MQTQLRLPAIEIKQGKRRLYTFCVDGKLIGKFATVSRVKREDGDLTGYQRPEQVAHIDEIRTFLESESPLLPNAVVVAFDASVKFEANKGGPATSYSRTGELVVPIDPDLEDHERPGFIVDGQQRVAAIRDAQIKSFPICVSSFIADSVREQTEQFILVNSTKPLPKGLIYELLPSTDALLPLQLERRKLPSVLVAMLNSRPASPLLGAIKTATNPEGRIKDNSILRLIENSLSDGILYVFRERDETPNVEAMYKVLCDFFRAVIDTWPDAWALPPKKSRLTHGAGIAGLGFLMDSIAHRYGLRKPPTRAQFAADLAGMDPVCHWTSGYWDFGADRQRRWDELQNTPKDIEMLVGYLGAHFKRRRVAQSR